MLRRFVSLFLIVAAAALPPSAYCQPEPSPPEMLHDAELTAIAFVNADRGWAVGDRGAIWHTADGGRSWKLQQSGVTCRLETVQFLDADNGFAVGGWTQPYTHETHGVVLRTRDGGRTWQNTPDLILPGLTHARFFDAKTGCALGAGSPLYPSGVFRTSDGGRTWSPVPKGDTSGWVTGDFRNLSGGAVAGLGGTLGVVMNNEVRPAKTPGLGPRYVRRMLLSGETDGWLVGDGGLVLTTNDGGFHWTASAGPLPAVAASNLDCRALAVHGSHVWVAGAPGTCVLHSPDGGQTWESHRTGQTLPLHGLTFIDEYRGWAVGSLGAILHTRDGGQTWRVQRTGGRVALLGIFSEPSRIPLELIALQSGSDGYLTAVEVIGRHDQKADAARPADFTAPQRTHAAVVVAGGSQADTAWRFPLGEAGVPLAIDNVLARWNQANDGQAAEQLEAHLVRRIRQWRPDVIVTEDVSPRGDNPLAHLTNQMTLEALKKAGDSAAYPDQILGAGLKPWKVKKVLTLLPGDKQGTINLTPAQWSPRLGRSLADVAEAGRGLLSADVVAAPRNIGLSLLVDHLPQNTGRRDVMSGIALQPGDEARRQLANPPPGDLEQLSRVAQKRHNIEQLLARIDSGGANLGNWIGQIDDLTRGLGERQSGEILWQLAQRYIAAGRSESAAEAMQLLLDKHAKHPLADRAALWLIQYYASSEVAWRQRDAARFGIRLATAVTGETATPQPTAGALTGSERAGRAIAIAKLLERTRPVLHADPKFAFPLAVAMRHNDQARATDQVFQSFSGKSQANPWGTCAAAEQWLLAPTADPPKRMLTVVRLAEKPKLDGRLDDATWQAAKSVSLKAAVAGEPTTVALLAYDDEFLYVAASCQKSSSLAYPADDRPRVPDEDFAQLDHLTILLDTDRDYSSYWRLATDARGRPAESCFGDATWNPQWYIAAGGDDQWWTIEAAIPLKELAAKLPQVRDIWAIGIQRLIPNVGLQAFSQPAAVQVRPEGFGLMVFE